MSSISHAVPVYTDSTYPRISVIDTADYYRIIINDQEGDSLFNVSYAWGTKPHVYAYVSVANDDTANWYFSKGESLRWQYIQDSTVKRWDQAVYNKHTMHFNFIKYPFLIDHTTSELQATYLGDLKRWGIHKFTAEYAESLETPYICIDGGYYFDGAGYNSPGSGDQEIGSIYMGYFTDAARFDMADTTLELLDVLAMHEMGHSFIYLPSGAPYFDALGHFTAATIDSQSGYINVYDPMNTDADLWNCYGEFYFSPLSQMCMGIRSKYEDEPLYFYGGDFSNRRFVETWCDTLDSTSSKVFYEAMDEGMGGWWNLHRNSPKTTLPDSTRTFLLPKSEQNNRSLLVYASDSLHPGYFKCFALGATSEITVYENEVPVGITHDEWQRIAARPDIRITPNPFWFRAEITVLRGRDSEAVVFGRDGRIIAWLALEGGKAVWDGRDARGARVRAGVYFVRVWSGGEVVVKRVVVY